MRRIVLALATALCLASPAALAESGSKSLPSSFELKGLTGGVVKRADLKGHKVVLQFFASWCKGCADVMVLLQPIVAASKGTRYLPVSVDETMAEAKGYFMRQPEAVKPMEKLAAHDGDATLATALGVEALPTIVIVDGRGKTLLKTSGHPSAEQVAEIRRMLGVP